MPPLNYNLIGAWKLENNSRDFAGTNHGTDTTITYAAGKVGQCATFNGTSSFIELKAGKLITTSKGSISVWIKSSVLADSKRIFGYGGTGGNAIFSLEVRNNGGIKAAFTVRDAAASFLNVITGSTTLSTNTWYHIVWTGSGSIYTLYVNSVAQTKNIVLGADNGKWNDLVTTTNDHTTLGSMYNNGVNGFFGIENIDELQIFNEVLNQAQVTELYNYPGYPFREMGNFN